jgi:licheninase
MMSSMLTHRKPFPAILAISLLGAAALAPQASAAVAGASPAAASAHFSHEIFYQQFRHPLKRHTWTVYQGKPTCCPQSYWAKSHVVSGGGILAIRTYRDPSFGNKWVSGGVSMARMVNQTYGRWIVRFRMPAGKGVGMDVALRPSGSGTVVDWIEESSDKAAARQIETATLHYGNTRVHAQVRANFTKWHTMSLSWTPSFIKVKLDGNRWAYYRSHIPSSPMHLVMQTNTGTNGFTGVMPDGSTPRVVPLQVDFVKVFSYR